MQYLRLLLLPFSFLYGLIIWLRNKAYDAGVFQSRRFKIPVISIGNLAVGGAGKSPMAENIIRLVKDQYKTAVLSRGYGRKTKGFRLVEYDDSPANSGDEPLQFRKKFKDLTVAVSEKRVAGIEALKKDHDVIIMDDAFQHRAVKPGLSILLFDYTRIHEPSLLLPAGNLREPFANRQRADIIIVSKCPEELSEKEKEEIKKRVKPFWNQSFFTSYLKYNNLIPVNSAEEKELSQLNSETIVFLLSGIANPSPLLAKIKTYTEKIIHHEYPDHHTFSTKNIAKLANEFKASSNQEKVIITTEKDFQRLQEPALLELLKDLPVYYLPVTTKIHQPDEDRFNNLIVSYVARNIQHNTIHKKQDR